MRNLLVMVGAPASGKSTRIKDNGLEQYTISPDQLRLQYSPPEMTIDGSRMISQSYDKAVWKQLDEILQERMRRGMFTVIDATHTKSSYFTNYKKLAEKYRYRVYVKEFYLPLDQLILNNLKREGYKRVPLEIISQMNENVKNLKLQTGITKIDALSDIAGEHFISRSMDQYENIHFVGDIHGMYSTLMDFMGSYSEKDLYVFVGDYVDRGTDSGKVMNYMQEMIMKENVICLEGNHERWLREWANDNEKDIRSSEFKNNTIPQLESAGYTKKMAREFYRRLRLFAAIRFDNTNYLVTHGGVVNPNISFMNADQIIKGVGKYDELDKVYETYNKQSWKTIQVHGHRNIQKYPIRNGMSINLEGGIETGGSLRVYSIGKDREPLGMEFGSETNVQGDFTGDFGLMEQHKYIQKKAIGSGLFSWNFTREAFQKGVWDNLTTKARGLFTNEKGKIVARSYNKFFNIGERPETEIKVLKQREGKFTISEKYNGFLGIFSSVSGKPMFFSKTTNLLEYAQRFERIARGSIDIDYMNKISSIKNCSFIFEVIDPVEDPHIIKYEKEKLVLLDMIDNDLEFVKQEYSVLCEVGSILGVEVRKINSNIFERSDIEWAINISKSKDEGLVLEGDDGFMVKYKTSYYCKWKRIRGYLSKINLGRETNICQAPKEIQEVMRRYMQWGLTTDSVITLREEYEKSLEK